jgi:hypothetical protein
MNQSSILKIAFTCLLINLFTVTAFANGQKATWQYVLNKDNVIFSVDINSINVVNHTLRFSIMVDDRNQDVKSIVSTVVNNQRQFLFTEAFIYDNRNHKVHHETQPTKWKSIQPNSPMAYIVDFISKNRKKPIGIQE